MIGSISLQLVLVVTLLNSAAAHFRVSDLLVQIQSGSVIIGLAKVMTIIF